MRTLIAPILIVALNLGISLPVAPASASQIPSITSTRGQNQVYVNQVLKLEGSNFDQVNQAYIDGVAASYYIHNSTLLSIRIPVEIEPGDASVTLKGQFGSVSFNNLFEVQSLGLEPNMKVTIGTFKGYAAVYTKNCEDRRLSLRIGNQWRVVTALGSQFTKNLTKVSSGSITTVMVYLDRELVAVRQILVK
jgi:hypothetical protein